MGEIRNYTMNVGPPDPTAHGVLRLVLEMDGEVIQKADPHSALLHRRTDKWAEGKPFNQSIGAGIVMDETTFIARALVRLARFYVSESCGQCTPCREGTGCLDRMLKRIIAGLSRSEDLSLLRDGANRIDGHTIFMLDDAAAWPAQSFLKFFRPKFQYMVEHKGRSILEGQSAVAA